MVGAADGLRGVLLFGPGGEPIEGGGVEIDLAAGLNRLEVTAVDALGRESVPETIVIKLATPALKPDLYELAVGVSQYRQAELALRYAAKDAQDLDAGFAQDLGHIYGEVHQRTILAARAGYFFATIDLDFASPEGRGLSFDQMESILAGLTARHRLMLVDTCAAGETDEDEVARAGGANPLAEGGLVASRGLRVKSTSAQPASVQLLMTRELFGSLGRGSGAARGRA